MTFDMGLPYGKMQLLVYLFLTVGLWELPVCATKWLSPCILVIFFLYKIILPKLFFLLVEEMFKRFSSFAALGDKPYRKAGFEL